MNNLTYQEINWIDENLPCSGSNSKRKCPHWKSECSKHGVDCKIIKKLETK